MATSKVHELGAFLREQRQGAKLSLRQLAEVAGVSNPYLSQVERGLRKPSAEVLQQIAKGLRISAEVLYVQAGILDEREDRAAVETVIQTDPYLTDRQRQVLLDIYASFRSENDQQQGRETTSLAEAVHAAADKIAPKKAKTTGARKTAGTKAATTGGRRTAETTAATTGARKIAPKKADGAPASSSRTTKSRTAPQTTGGQ